MVHFKLSEIKSLLKAGSELEACYPIGGIADLIGEAAYNHDHEEVVVTTIQVGNLGKVKAAQPRVMTDNPWDLEYVNALVNAAKLLHTKDFFKEVMDEMTSSCDNTGYADRWSTKNLAKFVVLGNKPCGAYMDIDIPVNLERYFSESEIRGQHIHNLLMVASYFYLLDFYLEDVHPSSMLTDDLPEVLDEADYELN